MRALILMVLAGVLWQAQMAAARDFRQGFRPTAQTDDPSRKKQQPEQHPRGDRDKREFREGRQHRNRLTDEERRELHRDLDRAHREIYRR